MQADGSGLSRYNYVCAETLVTILRQMYARPAAPGAVPGDAAGRRPGRHDLAPVRRHRAAGNVRAKTGSIANVRALSGYVTTADGEPLVFSIIANHFTAPQSAIDAATDEAVDRLANFVRKTRGMSSLHEFNH